MSMLDALDTMWIMGLTDEFREAEEWLADNLDFEKVTARVSVFETSIRAIGGLLAAYEVSGNAMFLTKATDLGERYGRPSRSKRAPVALPLIVIVIIIAFFSFSRARPLSYPVQTNVPQLRVTRCVLPG